MKPSFFPLQYCRVALAAAALILSLVCAQAAPARMVEVAWTPDDEQAEITTEDQARAVGFKRAVYAEALDILPGVLGEYRAELLRQRLMPRAAEYVVSYSEAATAPSAAPADANATLEGKPADATEAFPPLASLTDLPTAAPANQGLLRLDVTVNRAALKRGLKRMGVYYTISSSQPYDLSLTGAASGAWNEIGRLQALSGVSVIRNAEPLLEMDAVMTEPDEEEIKAGLKEAAPLWSARLSAGGARWTAEGRDMEAVWFQVWGGWFSRPEAEAGLVDILPLRVSGWYATDGIKAFADEMSAWEDVVESAVLNEIVMLPDGMAGIFSIRTMDGDALAVRLGQVLPQRGLKWELPEGRSEKQ